MILGTHFDGSLPFKHARQLELRQQALDCPERVRDCLIIGVEKHNVVTAPGEADGPGAAD